MSATKEQDAAFLDKCALSLLHTLHADAKGTSFMRSMRISMEEDVKAAKEGNAMSALLRAVRSFDDKAELQHYRELPSLVPLMLCLSLSNAVIGAAAMAKPPSATASTTSSVLEYFPMPSTGAPLPFSEAVKLGDTLYVSGQIGYLPGTVGAPLSLAFGGITPETRQTLDNVKAILERHGSSMERVIKCTVFLADIMDWPVFNAVYSEYFKGSRVPARSALAASGLAFNARVEVECIAYVPPPDR
jgi:2-iminobutanoate/2-iminopropanoate deaminase